MSAVQYNPVRTAVSSIRDVRGTLQDIDRQLIRMKNTINNGIVSVPVSPSVNGGLAIPSPNVLQVDIAGQVEDIPHMTQDYVMVWDTSGSRFTKAKPISVLDVAALPLLSVPAGNADYVIVQDSDEPTTDKKKKVLVKDIPDIANQTELAAPADIDAAADYLLVWDANAANPSKLKKTKIANVVGLAAIPDPLEIGLLRAGEIRVGTSQNNWNRFFVDNLGNTTINAALTVGGVSSFSGNITVNNKSITITGGGTINTPNLGCNNATFSVVAIASGAIDGCMLTNCEIRNTPIGIANPASAGFTSVVVDDGDFDYLVARDGSLSGCMFLSGEIRSTPIGLSGPASAGFTSVSCSGNISCTNATASIGMNVSGLTGGYKVGGTKVVGQRESALWWLITMQGANPHDGTYVLNGDWAGNDRYVIRDFVQALADSIYEFASALESHGLIW